MVRACAGALAFVSVAAPVAAPAAYPDRPIRLVVPAAPGGAIDVVGRIVSPRFGEFLGQNIVIDNRTGANNIIGTEIVSRAPADGYTLLITAGAHTINPSVYRKLPYDALRDFAPVSLLCESGGLVLVVHPAFPARTVRDLIDLAKASPGKFAYASGGFGNSTHLAGEMFNVMAGIRLVHVPYKGAGPATNDVLGGQVPVMFGASPTVVPMVKAGRLRPLGFTGRMRSPQLPDVPTVDEAGVKGYEMTGWYGMYAPGRTPAAIIARLNEAVVRVVKLPEVRERMAGLNLEAIGSSAEAFGAYLRADIEKYARIARTAGIEPQ